MAKNTSDDDNPKVSRFDTGNALDNAISTTPGTTGRYLVLFKDGASDEGLKHLKKTTGRTMANAAEAFTAGAADPGKSAGGDLHFETLGVAVLDSHPEEMQSMAADAGTESSPILAVEPERYVYAFAAPMLVPVALEEEQSTPVVSTGSAAPLEYLIGYRDAVDHLV